MMPAQWGRLKKYHAVCVIAGVLGFQFWTIVPRAEHYQSWYWPFMNYPMYSTAHYPGDQFIRYELWAGPADEPELLRFVHHRELHLTTFKYHTILKVATGKNVPVAPGSDELASELIARLATRLMPKHRLRLQIWKQTWTLGSAGFENRAGVRALVREWSPVCEFGPAGARCSEEIP